jgi:hypothetical protein
MALTGLIVTTFLNYFWLHKQTVEEVGVLGLVSVVGSYTIWFFLSLIVNACRVPWLLDADSGALIDSLEIRAQEAESRLGNAEQIKQENRNQQQRFGYLMQAGMAFSSDISKCQRDSDFMSWDRHFKEWTENVRDEMSRTGYLTDSAEFLRARDLAVPVVGGPTDFRRDQEQRRRILLKHQEFLADFVKRRLP